jgi:hypothetical protein
MKRILLLLTLFCGTGIFAQTGDTVLSFTPSPLVDFDAYLKLANEVYAYRQNRLVSQVTFAHLAKERKTVILDTRSDSMYMAKHVKGAIHLNFSDFTQENLARLIPDPNTCILIYCNNNFMADPTLQLTDRYFASKMAYDPQKALVNEQQLTLALNIPTFINLYGYGYRNVYELGELVASQNNPVLEFEGTAVSVSRTFQKQR